MIPISNSRNTRFAGETYSFVSIRFQTAENGRFCDKYIGTTAILTDVAESRICRKGQVWHEEKGEEKERNPSIHPSIHPSIQPSIHQPINPLIGSTYSSPLL
jgi:hypothetical protein